MPNIVYAQQQNETNVEEVEKISVTGSRIRKTELSEARPVFSFSGEDLQTRGFTNVADFLNQSPLFGAAQSPVGAQSTANAGQNQVNLFDLGTSRTLTLVNGRRFVTGQSATLGGSQVDLNSIPAALIERIETVPLTGAASYGADAIAGTVNIILKDDYEGFEVSAQAGNNEGSNYKQLNFSFISGGNFDDDRGNITFGMEYTKDDGVMLCDQEFLCNDNPYLDSPVNRYIDINGDGLVDDINGDGALTSADRQRTRVIRRDQYLELFGDYGSISPPSITRYVPSAGLGASEDGNFYGWSPEGDLVTCNAGPGSDRFLFTTGGDGICGTDFFDSVAQIVSPVSRYNAYASVRYEITEDVRYKADLVYSNSKASELVNQGGFQTGFFGGTSSQLTFDTSNPFLSDENLATMRSAGYTDGFNLHRFNNDLTSLGANSNENHTWRISNIFEGEFELADRDMWWDFSIVHGRNDSIVSTTGIVDGRFFNAVDARRVDDNLLEQIRLQDPENMTDDLADLDSALAKLQGSRGAFTGNIQRDDIICGAYADLASGTLDGFNSRASGNGLVDEDLPFIDGCQPLNLFGDATLVNSPEALAFIQGGPRYTRSDNLQTVYTTNVGGTAVELPAGPLDFVLGYERRIEESNYFPGMGSLVPITRSSLDQNVVGGFDTNEYYLEIAVPIIDASMDIPFVQSLEINAAYRNQEFNTSAPRGFEDRTTEEDVYQLSLMWDITSEVALRGTYATAFRNPSIQELFQPAVTTFISGDDPCDSRSINAGPNPEQRRANCESIGIDPDTFTSDIQDGTIPGGEVSGNQNLGPETNKSYSIGLLYASEAIEGLEIAVDYYNLEIDDYIASLTFEEQAAVCFDSANFPNEAACDSFTRDDDFQITKVTQAPINVSTSTFESVTLRAFYEYDFAEYGSVSIDSFTQHNITNELQPTPASEVQEDVGDFGDPEWLGTFDVNWSYGDVLVSWRTRWQESVVIDTLNQNLYASEFNSSTGVLDDGTEVDLFSGNFGNKSSSRFISDLSVGYSLGDNTALQLNVFNVLDRSPQDAGTLAWGLGHIGLDERLGRRFAMRINHKF